MQGLTQTSVLAWQKRFCSIQGCIAMFSFVAMICILVGLLCCILFQTEMNKSPILITSDGSYQSTQPVTQACVYPARDFSATATDKECPNFPTFYCPAGYGCYNVSSSNIPACYSDSNSCKNDTFCYNYINGLSFTSDEMAKELDLSFKTGWIVCFYLVAIVTVIFLVVEMPIVIIFRKKISNFDEVENIDDEKTQIGLLLNGFIRFL